MTHLTTRREERLQPWSDAVTAAECGTSETCGRLRLVAPSPRRYAFPDPGLRDRLDRLAHLPGMAWALAELDAEAPSDADPGEDQHTPRLPRAFEALVVGSEQRAVIDGLVRLHLQRGGRPFAASALEEQTGQGAEFVMETVQPLIKVGAVASPAPGVLRVVADPMFDPLSEVALWVGGDPVPKMDPQAEAIVERLTPRECAFYELARQGRYEGMWARERFMVERPDAFVAAFLFRAAKSDLIAEDGTPVTNGQGAREAEAHLRSMDDHGLMALVALGDDDLPGWWPTTLGRRCEPWIRKRLGWLYRLRWAGLESMMNLREGVVR